MRFDRAFFAALGLFGVVFVMLVVVPEWPWDAPVTLLFGWVPFVNRVGSTAPVRWGTVLSVGGYVVLLAAGGQLFLRWLYREVRSGEAGGWRMMWTVRGLVVVLLVFVAGIAAVGVVHQVAWLARSPEPMFERDPERRNRAQRIKCAANLRMIGLGLSIYANGNQGAYPPDLSHLIWPGDLVPSVMICPNTSLEAMRRGRPEELAASVLKPEHCSYVYLGRGLKSDVVADVVVAYERVEDHEGQGMNLLFADGHVEWFAIEQAEKVLEKSVEFVRQRVKVRGEHKPR